MKVDPHLTRAFLEGGNPPFAFVGSGLSRNYPDWRQLVLELAREVGSPLVDVLECERAAQDSETLLAAADDVDQHFRDMPGERRDAFCRIFPERNANRPSVFSALVRAPFAFFVTTNYDTNIEDAFRAARGTSLDVVSLTDPHRALEYVVDRRPFVFKVHGCVSEGGPFVLSATQYRNMIHEQPGMRLALSAIFALHPAVFLGFGFRDPHINWYLEWQRSHLSKGRLKCFAFVRMDGAPQFIVDYMRRAYGLRTTEIDDWSTMESWLTQITFLQMRTSLTETRGVFRTEFQEFVKHARIEQAFGAIMYIMASSDLGHLGDCRRFLETLSANMAVRTAIAEDVTLMVCYKIVEGQFFKRTGQWSDAAAAFAEAARLSQESDELVAPLKSMAYRYYAILLHRAPEPHGNTRLAHKFMKDAAAALTDESPIESLDVRKWAAILEAEAAGSHKAAAEALQELATEAEGMGYHKNAAWSQYNFVSHSLMASDCDPPALETAINQAAQGFSRLGHHRGQAACHALRAELWKKIGKPLSMIEEEYELAAAHALIMRDTRLRAVYQQLCDGQPSE